MAEGIEELAERIIAAQHVVFMTGAGISTESGIPDFRGPDGTWTKFNPEDFTFQKFLTRHETRVMSWQRFRDNPAHHAEPNLAHYALAKLERLGKVDRVITQNIDGLHQAAGSRCVLELHGWGGLQDDLNKLSKEGKWVEMGELIDDEILHTFAVVGEPEQIAPEMKRRYGDVVDRLSFYAPYQSDPDRWLPVIEALKAA